MELKDCIKTAFNACCYEYDRIFKSGFAPWANDERYSIHETNQVSKFMSSYKGIKQDCLTWMELSIPYTIMDEKNVCHDKTNHIDGFIIDDNKVIFIEAKRFSRLNKKITELKNDLLAVRNLFENKECMDNFRSRLPSTSDKYEFYCLLLADYWKFRNRKNVGKSDKEIPFNWDNVVLEWKIEEEQKLDKVDVGYSNKALYDDNYHLAYALFKLKDF